MGHRRDARPASFWDALSSYGDRVALVEGSREVTYAELDAIVERVSRSVTPRSLAFLLCENTVGCVAHYLALLRAKAVPILLGASIDRDLLDGLLRTYEPSYLCSRDGLWDGCAQPTADGYGLVDLGGAPPAMSADLAVMLTTSGSTGSPKFVRQSYANIMANTSSIVDYLGIVSDDRAITTLPMNYTYGLSIIQSHLMAGARIVLTRKTLFDRAFWSLFRESSVTTFGAVPYTYKMLDRIRFLQMDLPSLRYATQAGGRLGKELHERFGRGLREQGKDFVVMYGATEATARMSYVPAPKAVEKAGSIGIAIPGGRFEIVGDDGKAVNVPGVVGELVYYGPNVALGYAENRDDLARGDEWHGRLETGDMAARDEDGYHYVVGRKKRFLKIFGNRVNLSEVEELLASEGYEAACVGVDDHMTIYVTGEATGDVIGTLSRKTGLNGNAFTVRSIGEIPRNDSGKVLYSALPTE